MQRLCGVGYRFCGGCKQLDSVSLTVYNRCYELTDGEWKESNFLWYPRESPACTMLGNGSIWASGGWSYRLEMANYASSSEIFHPSINRNFVISSELPSPMYYHCIATINSTHLFMAGRIGFNHSANSAYIVDTRCSDFNFIQLPNLNHDRAAPACGVINNVRVESGVTSTETILIVAGGRFRWHKRNSKTTETFKLTGDWTEGWDKRGPKLPRPFYQGGYVSNSQHPLILVGGVNETNDLMDDIMEFNYEENKFQLLPGRLRTPRRFFAVTGVETDEDC